MMGDRDVRKMIDKTFDQAFSESGHNINRNNPDRIHAYEASRCTRLAYYERKDPCPADNATRISTLIKDSFRRSFKGVPGEYRVDSLVLDVAADLVIDDELVVRFEVVTQPPDIPHPRDLLYLNACLFAFNKPEGILLYLTGEGKAAEFSITKNNRMFQEIIRRARILSTLLKENKVPIVEPCDLCLTCKYYDRCYTREKKQSNFSLDNILGLAKKEIKDKLPR